MQAAPFPGRIGQSIADSTPWWPTRPDAAAKGANGPNVLVLFDDVGFADLGCDGSTIRTPAIEALAQMERHGNSYRP